MVLMLVHAAVLEANRQTADDGDGQGFVGWEWINNSIVQLAICSLAALTMIVIVASIICRLKKVPPPDDEKRIVYNEPFATEIAQVNITTSSTPTSDSETETDVFTNGTNDHPTYRRDLSLSRVQPGRWKRSSSSSDPESLARINVQLTRTSEQLSLSFISVENIHRHPNAGLTPVGVFGRIYFQPKSRPGSGCSFVSGSGVSSGEETKQQAELVFGQISREVEFWQTKKLKLKKPGRTALFDQEEVFQLSVDHLPVRISIYHYDDRDIRMSIGHCILTADCVKVEGSNLKTKKMVLTLDLFPTVAKAQANIGSFKLD